MLAVAAWRFAGVGLANHVGQILDQNLLGIFRLEHSLCRESICQWLRKRQAECQMETLKNNFELYLGFDADVEQMKKGILDQVLGTLLVIGYAVEERDPLDPVTNRSDLVGLKGKTSHSEEEARIQIPTALQGTGLSMRILRFV